MRKTAVWLAIFAVIFVEASCGGAGGGGATSSSGGSSGTTKPPGLLAGVRSTFEAPAFVAVDRDGTVYTTDILGCAVYKSTPSGTTLLAGAPGIPGAQDGHGADARFYNPQGVAVDSAGSVYVADSGNNTIRKIAPGGDVTTFAGSPGQSGFVDGIGAGALFNNPMGLAVAPDDSIYVADFYNAAVRKISPSGVVSTYQPDSAPYLYRPRGIAVGPNGDLFVVTDIGVTKLLASGLAPFVMLFAAGNNAFGIVLDSQGSILVSGSLPRLSMSAGKIFRFDGTQFVEIAGLDTPGAVNGATSVASFRQLVGLAVDSAGNLVVADVENGAVRQLSTNGIVSTLRGTTMSLGYADGSGADARFAYPWGIAASSDGTLYVSDFYNNALRIVGSDGHVSTLGVGGPTAPLISSPPLNPTGLSFAGEALWGLSSNANNYTSNDAAITDVNKYLPLNNQVGTPGVLEFGFVFDNLCGAPDGSVYISYPYGIYKWPFGTGSAPIAGAMPGMPPTDFFGLAGMVVDSAGNIFAADSATGVISKVTPGGVVSALAGEAWVYGHQDGVGTAAHFVEPSQLAIDDHDNLYVVHRGPLRKISPTGAVTTLSLDWGTPVLHAVAVRNGKLYGLTSNAVLQTTLPQ